MRRSVSLSFIFLMMVSACASAQVPPWLDAGKSSVDDVLDALQNSGKNLKSFAADVQMTTTMEVQDSSSTAFGKIWFQMKAGGDAAIRISLDHKKVAGKEFPNKIDYLLDDGWMTERTFAIKKETRIQLAPAGQKVNLFQLGKGPFPLPIGQDKKDVHEQFDVKIIPPAKDDPANTIHLQLTPKPKTPLAENFSTIEVWVDCKTRMPARMATENKIKSEIKSTDLLNLQLNPTLKPEDVSLPPLEPGWSTIDKPIEPAH